MTDRTDPGELAALVEALTTAARAAPPPGTEAACAAVAGIDRPGAAPLLAHGGVTAAFDADGAALPAGSPEVTPVREDTLFDLASVTKVVTALTAATMIEDGLLDPEAPVAEHLGSPHPAITARHLLTHTSGLPPVMPLWRIEGSREDRLAAIRRAELDAAPGTAHAYSCIGFILLGTLLEHLGGAPLPELARRRVLDPVGAHGAGWDPDPSAAAGAAATEHQTDPPRGLVRGSTHDETAWSLGGVGNAGVFATAADVLAIGRALIGRAPGPQLSPRVLALLGTDQLPPGTSTGAPWRQGFGLRVGQELAPGRLLPRIVGHPGFTGTSVLADPESGTVATLLTNRVHPRRERFTLERARREMARLAAA